MTFPYTSAREFVTASSQYLSSTSPPTITYPLTMAIWFWCDDQATTRGAMSIGTSGSTSHRFAIFINSTENAAFTAADASAAQTATSTNTANLGTWNLAVGVGFSATDRWIYLNGTGAAQSTGNRNPAGMNSYQVGASHGAAGATQFYQGRLAHPTVWNVTLTINEIRLLAEGIHPLNIRRNNIVSYHPLGITSPEIPMVGTTEFTLNAAPTIAAGPPLRLKLFRPYFYPRVQAAASVGSLFWWEPFGQVG